MRAYEFKSVIETRKQVEDQFKFFREMMAEKNRSSEHAKEKTVQRKQLEIEDQYRR